MTALGGEIHAPLGRSEQTVPIRLRRLVWMAARGSRWSPCCTCRPDRTEHHLVTGGQPVADLADDRVTATRLHGAGVGRGG